MNKVYALSHGHRCIPHRFGAPSFDHMDIMVVYDSEGKVIDHIRQNVKNRVDLLSRHNSYDTYPEIEEFCEGVPLVYARTSDDRATETQYYYYKSYEVE